MKAGSAAWRLPLLAVARPRLVSQLELSAPLALIRAPVGFGKTILLDQWLDERTPTADGLALRVRAGGTSPGGFWLAVLDALADVGLPSPALAEHRSLHGTAERMIAEASQPLVLVVDGFEQVAEDGLDRALLDLLWRAPHLRLLVALRGHRHFPAQVCAGLEPTVLGPHELAFSPAEIAQLLTTAGLDPDLTRAVHAETGGWPEPTATLTRALRARAAGASGLVDVSQTAMTIAREFLRQRVLPDARPDRIEFALTSALPEEVTIEVAELLSGDPAAKAHLDWLDAAGMVHADTRDDEQTYRWPAAARRALLHELHARRPDQLPQLHARLTHWYIDHDQSAPALRHALDSGDRDLAVAAIEAGWRPLLMGHRNLLHQALIAVPLEAVAASPRALAVRDIMLQRPDDRILTAAPLPNDPAALADLGRHRAARDTLDAGLAVLVALRRRGLFDHAHLYAGQLLQIADTARVTQPNQVSDLLPGLHLQAGNVQLLGDDLTGALHPLHRAYDYAVDGPALPYVQANAAAALALAYAVLGEPGPATAWLHRHDTAPDPQTWLEPSIRTTAAAARLLLALDRLNIPAATTATAETLINRVYTNELWAYHLYARTQHALHTGALLDALDQLDRDRAQHRDWLDHGATAGPLLLAAEADLLLALGRGNQAHAILHGPHAHHPLLRVGQARLALLTGDNVAALHLATDAGWAQSATSRHRLEMLLIHAVVAHRTGHQSAATQALRHAAGAAATSATLRAFTTVPREDLTRLAGDIPPAAELIRSLDDHPELYAAQVTLIQLTDREHTLLHKLAAGLTIQQIARQLVVSPNTIKTQRRTLYQKLNTTTRPAALASARSWGLLPTEPLESGQRRTGPGSITESGTFDEQRRGSKAGQAQARWMTN